MDDRKKDKQRLRYSMLRNGLMEVMQRLEAGQDNMVVADCCCRILTQTSPNKRG
jgi:hypothetical protein